MRALEYGISFALFSTATIVSATPKPYVFQSKEEFKSAYVANVENKQPLNLTVGNYSNDLISLGLGLAATYFLVRLIMSLDNKPIMQQPAQTQVREQSIQVQPFVLNNNIKNVAVSRPPQERAQQPRPSRTVDDSEQMDNTGAWILAMMMSGASLKRQHYKIDGVTQSGKTTLAEHLLSIMSEGNPLVEKLLIDPKYRKGKPNWSFKPYCSDIEKVPKALDDFGKEIVSRQQSDEDFGELPPAFFVIDEWDWIFTDHGKAAVTKLRKLIKVGAELGCYALVLGQSPLSGDTGLSTSDFDQMVRISIGKSAIKVLRNPAQFPFSNRDELLAKAELLFNSGERFALVQEHGVTPRLEIVPKIVKPNQSTPDIELVEDEIPNNNVIPLRRAV